jgi:hypothetical protein
MALQPWQAQAAVNTVSWPDFSVFEEQVANLLPQHHFESACGYMYNFRGNHDNQWYNFENLNFLTFEF